MKACCITKHLRVIPNVWHFQSKVGFRVYGGMVRFRGGVAHTLMRRYVTWRFNENRSHIRYF